MTILQQASQNKAGRILALVATLHDPGHAQFYVRGDYVLLSLLALPEMAQMNNAT